MGANPVSSSGFSRVWEAIQYAVRGNATRPNLDALRTAGGAAGAGTMGCACGEESIAPPSEVAPGVDGGPGDVIDFTPPPPPEADGGMGVVAPPPPRVVPLDAGDDTPPPPADAGPGSIPTERDLILTSGCPEQCPDRNERAIQAGPVNPRYSRIQRFGEFPMVCSVAEEFHGTVAREETHHFKPLLACATFAGLQDSYPYNAVTPLESSNQIYLCSDREGDDALPPPQWEPRDLKYRGMTAIGNNLALSSDNGVIFIIDPTTGQTLHKVNLWEAGWDQNRLPFDINNCRTSPTLGGGAVFDAAQSVLYVVFANRDLKRDPFFLIGAERSLLAIPVIDGQLVTDKSRFQLIEAGRGAVGIALLGESEKVVLRFDDDAGQGRPAFLVHLAADNRAISEIPLTGFEGRISPENNQLVVPAGTRTVFLKTLNGGDVVVVDIDTGAVSTIDAFGDVEGVASAFVSDITCFDLEPADGLAEGCSISLSTGLEQFVDLAGNRGPRFSIGGGTVYTGTEAQDLGDGIGGVIKLNNDFGVFIYP